MKRHFFDSVELFFTKLLVEDDLDIFRLNIFSLDDSLLDFSLIDVSLFDVSLFDVSLLGVSLFEIPLSTSVTFFGWRFATRWFLDR